MSCIGGLMKEQQLILAKIFEGWQTNKIIFSSAKKINNGYQ